ncbi:hypothetical protein niasHT_016991 [Heterodera trifolii]|uniref:Uncharacterized protein n=2 Tax=Heterodera TaxID=34509 RepID=A0ABD2LAN2_9BILA
MYALNKLKMPDHFKKTYEKAFTNGSGGKRLQIRGFPAIWTEKLTFDDIAWFLFDLLVKYGAIDNINISMSKTSVIYGIVDMMGAKDAQAVFDKFLDAKGHHRLDEWNTTLQFKLLGGTATTSSTEQQPQQLPKKTMTTAPPPPPPPTTAKPTAVVVAAQRDANTSLCYARDELMSLKNNASRDFKVDDQFTDICRTTRNFRQFKGGVFVERKAWRPPHLRAHFERSAAE